MCYIYNLGQNLSIQWFTDPATGGVYKSTQYCPFYDGIPEIGSFNGYCHDSRGNNNASLYYSDDLASYSDDIVYGLNSRCVVTNSTSQLGLCLEHLCFGYNGNYVMNLNDIFIKTTGQWQVLQLLLIMVMK